MSNDRSKDALAAVARGFFHLGVDELHGLVDDPQSPALRSAREHLDRCEACGRRLDEIRAELASDPGPPPDPRAFILNERAFDLDPQSDGTMRIVGLASGDLNALLGRREGAAASAGAVTLPDRMFTFGGAELVDERRSVRDVTPEDSPVRLAAADRQPGSVLRSGPGKRVIYRRATAPAFEVLSDFNDKLYLRFPPGESS